MAVRRVRVHIESLALHGFRHEDRYEIAAGLESELGRLLASPEMAAHLAAAGHVTRLDAGRLAISHASRPRQVGVQSARGIARRMKP
jgi:hypothetical protein